MAGETGDGSLIEAGMLAGEKLRILSIRLKAHGLAAQVVSYNDRIDLRGDEVSELVITNPEAPEYGEMRICDDGWVTWDYSAVMDGESAVGRIVTTVIATLTASSEAAGLS